MTADDPGRQWTERLLEPLRRAQIDIDVAPRVMARIMAGRFPASGRIPLGAPGWRTGLAWTASFAGALLVLAILSAAILGRRTAGPEIVQLLEAARVLGKVGMTFTGALVGLAGAMASAGAPFVRSAWAILQVAAPLVRSAGLLTAACGGLSILVSLYVFAAARRGAPAASPKGGLL